MLRTLSIRKKKPVVDTPAGTRSFDEVFRTDSPLPPLPPLQRLQSFFKGDDAKVARRFGTWKKPGQPEQEPVTDTEPVSPTQNSNHNSLSRYQTCDYDPVEVCLFLRLQQLTSRPGKTDKQPFWRNRPM
jgi:hypothetical protein